MALPPKTPSRRFTSQKDNKEIEQVEDYIRKRIIISQETVQPLRGGKQGF
jgi:hypothetical protein